MELSVKELRIMMSWYYVYSNEVEYSDAPKTERNDMYLKAKIKNFLSKQDNDL